MITVKIEGGKNKVSKVNVKGHALFADPGSDIICASISGIVFGALNACDILANNSFKLEVNKSINFEILDDTEIAQNIIETMIIQLQTVEEEYPDYLKINRKE